MSWERRLEYPKPSVKPAQVVPRPAERPTPPNPAVGDPAPSPEDDLPTKAATPLAVADHYAKEAQKLLALINPRIEGGSTEARVQLLSTAAETSFRSPGGFRKTFPILHAVLKDSGWGSGYSINNISAIATIRLSAEEGWKEKPGEPTFEIVPARPYLKGKARFGTSFRAMSVHQQLIALGAPVEDAHKYRACVIDRYSGNIPAELTAEDIDWARAQISREKVSEIEDALKEATGPAHLIDLAGTPKWKLAINRFIFWIRQRGLL